MKSAARLLLLLLLLGCRIPPAQPAPRIHGIEVEVQSESGIRLTGELLAVSQDSLWILLAWGGAVRPLPLAGVVVRPLEGEQLRPQRWAWIGGFSTGFGMSIACNSYEPDASCFLLLPGFLMMWHLVGLGAQIIMALDPADPLDPDPDNLRRFCRFPAGLPPGFP